MSVKKKDRHTSKSECLNQVRVLVSYLLVLTRPQIVNDDGTKVKPGLLGCGQPYTAFGADLFACGKAIHANCFEALEIYLKDEDTLKARREYFNKAISYCNSILRLVDLCIFQYAQNNKKKRKSFEHLARLTRNVKFSIQDRLNRDNLIYQHQQEKRGQRPPKKSKD